MAVSTQRTLSTGLFSHWMVQCVLGVSLQTSETVRKMIFWTWELGPDGKSNNFSLCKQDSCTLKPTRKTHCFIFLFISTTHLVKYLSFLEEKCCMPHLAWNSSDRTVSPDQGDNRYASHTHRRLSPDLFSHGIVQGVYGCVYKAQKLQQSMFLQTWELRPDGKRSIFPLWKLDNCLLKTARKTPYFIFLFITATALVKHLNFLVTGCLSRLAGKSSDSTVSPDQSNNSYASEHSQNTLPWPHCSWDGAVCPRSVFTYLWNCWETWFCEPRNWGLNEKAVHSTCETWIVAASNLPQKHSGSFFFS